MPLVQIDIAESVPPERRRAIADAVNTGLVRALGMPAADRFQILRTHPPGELIFDPSYLGVDRRQVVFIQILMVSMYDDATKRKMLGDVADQVVSAGVRRDDVFLAVAQNTAVDWYPGKAL
jgi:hypothetical protein